jgi:hypothetical protein
MMMLVIGDMICVAVDPLDVVVGWVDDKWFGCWSLAFPVSPLLFSITQLKPYNKL